MKVFELINWLEDFSEDAEVCFYDFVRNDDMYLRDISVSDYCNNIFINISR